MTTNVISNGQTVQTAQDQVGNVYLLTGNSTVVSAGADMIFASNNPTDHSNIFATGIAAVPGGYQSDTVVLGASSATVVLGGIDPLVFGGTGHADIFWGTTPARLIAGAGDINVIGNPTGAGIDYAGGAASIAAFNGGRIVHEGNGHTVTLWAGGPTG